MAPAFLALCLAAAVSAGEPPRVDPAGFDLRAGPTSSKLNDTSAGADAVFQLPPQPTPAPPPSGPDPQPAPDVARPVPAFELPPVPPLLTPNMEDGNTYRIPHRGETPMTRTWNRLGLPALLAAALTVSPARAEPEKNDPINEYKKLEAIQTTLAEMQTSLKNLDAIRRELQDLRTGTNVAIQKAQADINSLTEKVAQLQRDLDAVRGQSGPTNRIALSSPAGALPGAAAVGTLGRILLRNTYGQRVSVIVNGRSYPLDPGGTWVLENQPLGTFTYEVLGGPAGVIQPRQERVLTAEKPFEITVYTR